METHWVGIVVCAVLSMVIGYLWFGPLFSKKWLEAMNVTPEDLEKRKSMQASAGPLYGVQVLLSLLQLFILSNLITFTGGNGVIIAIFMWLGFVMPTLAGSAMWNTLTGKQKWTLFSLTAGYQLVMFIIYGYILSF